MRYNANAGKRPLPPNRLGKVTATLSLPFFEDFTGYGIFPDSTRWVDYHTYVNNTMCVMPVSRGVATLDALDWRGIPYDSFSNSVFRYADSLTTQPIDVATVTPADSLYLSFVYQPQGNGFYPLPQDSLMVFIKTKYGGFVKVWATPGTTLQPFRHVMIPITDTIFFSSSLQVRFVNIAALNWSDAVWNVDYVRLNTGRTMGDTVLNDVAISSDPTFLLNDYTSMPYRHFIDNPAGERAANITDSIRNNYNSTQSVNSFFSAVGINTGVTLQSPVGAAASIPGGSTRAVSFPSYSATIPFSSVGYHDKVVFEHKVYFESVAAGEPHANDTIVKPQVFDNYLAYDDGSAEKSYYLNLFPTLPGKIAIEYHLNRPDTMRGMAIYFGRQVPFAVNKVFDINIYSALAGVNGAPADTLKYEQEMCYPGYTDTVNHFWIYKFDQPVPLPAGTFYAGTMQPAESGSDSLYFGLDVNRIGGNHAYYNVLAAWSPSLITGAIMMRPLLGQPITGTGVQSVTAQNEEWQVFPNPATNNLQFDYKGDWDAAYRVSDMQGRVVLHGIVTRGRSIDISLLTPGMYVVQLVSDEKVTIPKKIIKL
ncbi:MAG: T9SS type A sorting domain-containing protein [Bacteroidota bacterium]